jgi:hypothetical protein
MYNRVDIIIELARLLFKNIKISLDKINQKQIIHTILNLIDISLLPHVGTDSSEKTRKRKLLFMGLLIRKIILTKEGHIKETDRDSLNSKRLHTAGISYSKSFKTIFRTTVYNSIKKQFKDYLTPGRIDFRTNDNANYYPYPYGIKSQVTPFYQWKLSNITTIFGDENNTWATDQEDIVQNKRFQGLDRTSETIPNYFRPSTSSVNNDLYARGYIFSVDSSGVYSTVGATSNKFIVGAPFHFYFGTVKGESALDKFKTKYSIIE